MKFCRGFMLQNITYFSMSNNDSRCQLILTRDKICFIITISYFVVILNLLMILPTKKYFSFTIKLTSDFLDDAILYDYFRIGFSLPIVTRLNFNQAVDLRMNDFAVHLKTFAFLPIGQKMLFHHD